MADDVKGYVVRGKDRRGVEVWCFDGFFRIAGPSEDPPPARKYPSPTIASAGAVLMTGRGCTDVAIFAVAEDGTETPILSHEEALAENERLRTDNEAQRFRAVEAEGAAFGANEEIERLRAEVERLQTAEHQAWARLLRAHVEEADALRVREDEYHLGERLLDVARQNQGAAAIALFDLGVDVDALLKEAER